MSFRLLAASVASFGLSLAPTVQAQEAFEPATASSPAPAPLETPATPSTTDALEGRVSYYGRELDGRKTSSGERFNASALTMAHRTLPFGTMVRVTNLRNKKSVIVRVNDRGPNTPRRVGDVSAAAAHMLGMLHTGVIEARLEVVGMAEAQKVK
ncbi:MAG TPA: septal ring lytic transglycosylase RlpA family protein [Burkholderiales bacterium]|nr:septal ring lytic transglycosylase RlpA family protein [Burkholderiales bacterium]